MQAHQKHRIVSHNKRVILFKKWIQRRFKKSEEYSIVVSEKSRSEGINEHHPQRNAGNFLCLH